MISQHIPVGPYVKEEKRGHGIKARTFRGIEVSDEGEQSLEDLEQ